MPILGSAEASTGDVVSAVESWNGATLTWTDYTGAVWDLSDPGSGVVCSGTGITGLNMPPITRYTSTSPEVAGSRWKGFRVEEREVFLPLYVYSNSSSEEWLERDRAFWAGVRPDAYATLTFTAVDGQARTLQCRYSDDGTDSVSTDPAMAGWHLYGVTMVADDDPMWNEASRSWTFRSGVSGTFFDTTGGVIFISSSQTLADAQVLNESDIDVYPRWEVLGPVDAGLSLGVGGGAIVYNSAVAEGELVVFDADPTAFSATSSVSGDVSSSATWKVLPLPVGNPVRLTIDATSATTATTVTFSMTPRYYRAW